MAKLLTLILCLGVFSAASALKCKRCKEVPNNEDCHEMEDENCQGATTVAEPACLTQIYNDTQDQKRHVEKRCVNKPIGKDKQYDCVWRPNTTHGDLKDACQTCTDDKCNEKSAASMRGPYQTLVGVVAAALLFPRLM